MAPLLTPKSDRYTWSGRPGRASTKMFAGLTSRCTSPAACAASSAEATGEMNAAARPGASAPSRCSTSRRSPPWTNRIAMNSTPSASPASYTGMMCGSSTAAAARDSAINRRRNAGSAASSRRQDLQRHQPTQPLIASPEHHRHPARPDLRFQPVPRQQRACPKPGRLLREILAQHPSLAFDRRRRAALQHPRDGHRQRVA